MAKQKDRIRLLYVTHSPLIGGAELSLVAHIKTIDTKKFDVYVVGSTLLAPLVQDIPHIHFLPMQFYLLHRFNPMVLVHYGKMVWQIMHYCRKYHIDIIHTNSVKTHYVGSIAALFSRTKIIWWIRDTTFNPLLYRMLHRIPTRIVSVSYYIKSFYITEKKNIVVYNGSDIYKVIVSQEEVGNCKRELGITNEFVVGTIERLVEGKGVIYLIDAFARFLKKHPRSRLIIVGEGSKEHDDVSIKLRDRVEELGIAPHVQFLGWRSDIVVLLHIFSICVHPAIIPEPFGLVVLEAMMRKCLVASSAIGAPCEFVENGKMGILFPPSDSNALEKVLEKVADGKIDSTAMKEAAYTYAVEHLTQEFETKNIEQIYRDCM